MNICGTAMHEVLRKHDGIRWCFACRERRSFDFVVRDSIEPSYWPAVLSIKCTHCGQTDGDLGFGRVREWD